MSKNVVANLGLVLLAILAIGALSLVKPSSSLTPSQSSSPTTSASTNPTITPSIATQGFGTAKKSAHFAGSTPAHGTTLPAAPVNIVIDVDFDLAPSSTITIKRLNPPNLPNAEVRVEYGQGDTTVDTNKLAMRRAMDPAAPNDIYQVTYRACWPDSSCHTGIFAFAVDTSQLASFADLRNQTNLHIDLKNIEFTPEKIRISHGTTITWENHDTLAHYVNTDSHPAHTYYPAQSSQALKPNETYTVTFDSPGSYPYHCSAHASTMTGLIVVE